MIDNLINKKFSRLMPIKYCGQYKWECLCDCGKITIARTSDLNNGNKKSCGCLRKETTIKNNNLRLKYTDEQRKANRESYKKYKEKRLTQAKIYVNNNRTKVYERQRNWRMKTGYCRTDKYKRNQKIKYRKYRNWIIKFKIDNGCILCGEKRFPCLDFHHRDPKTKSFNISEKCYKQRKIVEEEIKKCDIVCANCHWMIYFNEKEKWDYVNFKEAK